MPDNLTNPGNETPTATPVGTPLGTITTKTIGANGGSVASTDGKAELIFPAGVLTTNTDISIQAITNNAPNGVGNAYRLLPEGIQFTQPVTLKFHYTAEDLAVTLGDLMGIAFQDSTGIWYRVNSFTNDTTNKVISASIQHFSDWTNFEVMRILPATANVKIKNTLALTIEYVDPGSDEGLAPLIQKTKAVKWSVNGNPGGNATVGTISGSTYNVTYTAPAKKPSVNPVDVQAELPYTLKFHGVTFNKLLLISHINVTDNEKYLLKTIVTESTPPLVYTDSAKIIFEIDTDQTVVVTDIFNFAPACNPSTATLSGCTATWIPDAIGEVNVFNVTGVIDASVPGIRKLYLTVNHTAAVSPKFTQECPPAAPVTSGGEILTYGIPHNLYFELIQDVNIYEQDDGREFERLTRLE
ncbi:MAG: hypothetical protein M3N30_02395 [Bacteroidota bacterium]|nr:hypothetical protein [Bacteroidota bacterium]